MARFWIILPLPASLRSDGGLATVHRSPHRDVVQRVTLKLPQIIIGLYALVHLSCVFAHPNAHNQLEYLSAQIKAQAFEQSLYIQRGIAYSNDGQFEPALADFRKAESLGDPIAVAFDLGVLFYRNNELERSRLYFDTYLKYFPEYAPALEYRARVRRDAGDYQGALADFNAFFAFQPRPNPGHYISAAKMLAAMEDEGIDDALLMLDKGIEQLGLIPQLQHYAIELEMQRKRPTNAIQRLNSLEPMLGSSPGWKVQMAEISLLIDQPAKARQLLQAATAQLVTLKQTPARQQLLIKIRTLEESKKSLGQRQK